MTRFEAILFDLDDTLYPERAFVLSGFKAVASWAEMHLGVPQAQGLAELIELFGARDRGHTFDTWLESHGKLHKDTVACLVEIYREHTPDIVPYPEALALLEELRSNYKLGLISDGYLAVQRRKLAALRVANYFDTVVFSDEWGREAWKPALRPFEEALGRLDVVFPARTLYIGDNPRKDFYGARRLGMKTIRVRHTEGIYTCEEPVSSDYAPDVDIFSLTRVIVAIKDLEVRL